MSDSVKLKWGSMNLPCQASPDEVRAFTVSFETRTGVCPWAMDDI